MEDLADTEKPRKLLRWAESSGEDPNYTQDPENKDNSRLTNESAMDEDSAKPGDKSDNHETTVLTKREDWYGAKMQRLKDSVEKLRKDLRDKERDYMRLKNKYNIAKRKQEQLLEDVSKQTENKLDTDSELEFLRLQLVEKEKELSKYRENHNSDEKSGKTKPGEASGLENGVSCGEISLESCLSDSYLTRKYLHVHKDIRRWMVYGILGAACGSSLIALLLGSTLLSTITVGLWTLGLFCLCQERKELYRALKLKHLRKIREMTSESALLRGHNAKLVARKNDLERTLLKEIEEKDGVTAKFKSLSEKIVDVKAKNEELAMQVKSTFEELQSERVRRRRAEEQLEEVSAQVLVTRQQDEMTKCGDVCRELRDSLESEIELNEKLSRENQRLIEEIVALNMKEEKRKIERENEKEVNEKVEIKELKYDEEMEAEERKDENEQDNTETKHLKAEEMKSKIEALTESKIERSNESKIEAFNESKIEALTESKIEALTESKIEAFNESKIETSNEFKVKTPNARTSGKPSIGTDTRVKQNGGIVSSSNSCWLCAMNVSQESRVALSVLLVACLVLLFQFILSSKVYFFLCLLCMAVVGTLSYYRVSLNINVNPFR